MITLNQYMDGLSKLEFSDNWNNKLNAKVFTTIRRQHNVRFQIGNRFTVDYKDKLRFVAQVADVRHCKAGELSLWEMALDTGYGRAATINVLCRMHHCKTTDQAEQLPISYVLLQRVPQEQLDKELSITQPTTT